MEELNIKELGLKKSEVKISKEERHMAWLREVMFFISHKLRQPVTTILGLSNVINSKPISKPVLKKILLFIRQSAFSLDKHTREISTLVNEKIISLKKGTHHKK